MYDKIASICSGFNNTCLRCGNNKETLIHAMKDCLKARVILEYGGFNNKFLVGNYSHCIDWIEEVACDSDKTAISDFITILWNIWNSRNNNIFQGVEKDAKVT